MLEPLRTIPAWALLSLVMNGLLFAAVLASLRQPDADSQRRLSQASASMPPMTGSGALVPQLGDRQYLDYQQWVNLLRQEAIAAQNLPRLTVLLGDSISLWFPPELLPGRRSWLNQGISGEWSAGLQQRLNLLDDAQVETVFVMIGINDLIGGEPEWQVVDNVEATIVYLQAQHPGADIVVQPILPHGGERATWEGRDRLLDLPIGRIQAVNESLQTVARRHGVLYLDLYPLFADGEGYLRPDLTTDGLHLNAQGYWVWRTAIALILNTELEP
ncbi:GDSL-type esterase/lipase family protein [Leptolyngbya sp. PCC 6406]|uniref:GDSL-type esterase/lipase family protein n=1 Tax=Leptolyngbya sp. PCC 6406 TaxID=1173264 RepID=UPI0002AC336C|nr:GDSL-type esterase/lipase family protein [Leptolyngbya sp. PCC 6406]